MTTTTAMKRSRWLQLFKKYNIFYLRRGCLTDLFGGDQMLMIMNQIREHHKKTGKKTVCGCFDCHDTLLLTLSPVHIFVHSFLRLPVFLEKRKQQKNVAAKSKETCTSFKKSTAPDLVSLKKRRRAVFEDLQQTLSTMADEHAAAEAAWQPVAEAWASEHEQKIAEIVKV